MSEVADTGPVQASPSSRTPPAAPPGDAAAGGTEAVFKVPLEAIVFRPRGWSGPEGSSPSPDQVLDCSTADGIDEALLAGKPPVDGVDGTQRRFWVAPPQGDQADGGDYDIGLESNSVLLEPGAEWESDSGLLEPGAEWHPDDVDDNCALEPAIGASAAPAILLGTAGGATQMPTPPPLGTALAGGAALAGLPLFGSEWTVRAVSSVDGRSSEVALASPPSLPGFVAAEPRLATSSSFENSNNANRRVPAASERGNRPASAGPRRPEQPVAGSRRSGREVSSQANSRTGTPLTIRSRSATPSGGSKRTPKNSMVQTTDGRRVQRGIPVVQSASKLEAENASLRAEVIGLRSELRAVMNELAARTEDMREVSSLLALRQSHSQASNLGDGSSEGQRSGGMQLSGICAEALVSRSSIIARLEADNEMYRARVVEQDRMLLELQSEMQAQTREVQSLVSSKNFVHAASEADTSGRGHLGKAIPFPSTSACKAGGGSTSLRPHGQLGSQVSSGGSLGFTPPSMPSPRLDGRLLR